MAYLSPRLPHVLTRTDLSLLVAPTYAEATGVDEDEAHDRTTRALAMPALLDELYHSISEALVAAKAERSLDELMDKVSRGVMKRRGRMKAAAATPALAALMVRWNLELGLAPETMRGTLEGDKGRALLDQGRRALATHLVTALLR